MERRFINPLELSVPAHYSHVAIVTAGRTVYVSGQVALDATGHIRARQRRRRIEELRAAGRLECHGPLCGEYEPGAPLFQ